MNLLRRLGVVLGLADPPDPPPTQETVATVTARDRLVEQTAIDAVQVAEEAQKRRDRLNLIRAERRIAERARYRKGGSIA